MAMVEKIKNKLRGNGFLLAVTIVLFFVLYIAGAILYGDRNFTSPQVFLNLFISNAGLIIAAVGMTFVLITGGIDISIGSVIGVVCMMLAWMMEVKHMSAVVAIILVLAFGVIFGLVQGFLVAYLKIQPFIVTLGGMFFARGLTALISSDMISIENPTFLSLANYRIYFGFITYYNNRGVAMHPYIYLSVVIALLVVAISFVILRYTKFGRAVFAVGGNEQSALLMGLNPKVTKLKDGTEIHWIINPNQDGVYQQKLDEALMKQADASADDKVDIYLSETDYVFKYTDKDADVAMPLTDLGIDPDKDLADQYDFTKTTASDADGVQRGSTWQCCPGLLVYRRDIAKDVFGTDDPEKVAEKVKDWDTMKQTAQELKDKGYYTFASYADTFRLYGNSIDNSWVEPGETTINVDKKITDWISDSKEWLDAGYLNPTVKGQWNDDWNKAMSSQSKVFAFLFPAWGIDFTLKPNWDGEEGQWAVTNPPQEYNWGGSYIHAATGTDNPEHAKDILLAMTADKDNLLKISKEYSDFTNTKSGMEEAAKDDATFASDFLGGQNAFKYFAPVAENIKIAPLSSYDQGCVELIQNSFSDYLQGKVDYDKAKTNFETAIKERYPDITEVKWPE